MTAKTFTIGQMCADFDVTPRTLRFYEYKELLAPVRDGQRRLFTPTCRARLKLILRGKRFGFSLLEIKDLLDLYDVGDGQRTQLAATLDAAARHHGELIAQRDELSEAIGELEDQMDVVRTLLADKDVAQAAE